MKNLIKRIFTILLIYFTLSLIACSVPDELKTDHIPAVKPFDLDRYLGTWYEIARLPHKFEKNLERVTATYTLRDDGKISVVNRGYNIKSEEWEEAEGRAWIPDPEKPAKLKVSFFLFFASDYKIIELDQENYTYAMVTSSSKEYLWILSRTPQLEEDIYDHLVDSADQLGFDVTKIHKVSHN
jgi:apolipoprotein D and lipocalin family protein